MSKSLLASRFDSAVLFVSVSSLLIILSTHLESSSSVFIQAFQVTYPTRIKQDSNEILTLSSTNSDITSPLQSKSENRDTTPYGAISMSLEELGPLMGGTGRARLVWDCYSIGIDPDIFHRDNPDGITTTALTSIDDYYDETSREIIRNQLPTPRKTQKLGVGALEQLRNTYRQQAHSNHLDETKELRVEGGIASLSHFSQSSDNTTKLLLQLQDGLQVETVIIPWQGLRSTLCISSQVGCLQACQFCATGKMGKVRSLTSDEILAQMYWAVKICRIQNDKLPPIRNIVFMGMGEPADNAEAVDRAARILTGNGLFHLSASKVTVSTVAPSPDAFLQFADTPCVLAWSVHAARDDLRKQLVPTTKYKMTELRQGLIDALLKRPNKNNFRTTMLEVALMAGVNDSLQEADELAELARGIMDAVPGCKLVVNLIPFNEITLPDKQSKPAIQYHKPSKERVDAFVKRLRSHDIYTHIRATRGDDESAACGQLATNKLRDIKKLK